MNKTEKKHIQKEVIKYGAGGNEINETLRLQAGIVSNEIIPLIFHKLKNKLTPVLGFSQIIQMKSKDPMIVEKARKIEVNAEKLTFLFEKLRDRYGKFSVPKIAVSLGDVIGYFKNSFREIEKFGIRIETDIKDRNKTIQIIKGQISLLVKEVVSNSIISVIQKGVKSGLIKIETGVRRKDLYVKIWDNGVGLDSKSIDMIAEPFFSNFPGRNGIGYLLIGQVVENHNGYYKIRSVPGEFFEIEIRFPFNMREENGIDEEDKYFGFTNLLRTRSEEE